MSVKSNEMGNGIPPTGGTVISDPNKKKVKSASGFATDFLMGGVSAAISKCASAPIERVKLLLQNQDEMLKQGRLARPYTGIIDCTRRTYRSEGVIAFWRGNTANVVRYFPTQALNFAFRDYYKTLIPPARSSDFMPRLTRNVASGALAGATSSLFVYSLDYTRTRLAADAKSTTSSGGRQFSGMLDVYKKTLKSDGVAGLYRGFGPNLVGIVIYRGLYFGLYDTLKPTLLTGALSDNFLASFLLGWACTVAASQVSYPLDTIRRRMMMTSGSGVHYGSMFHAGREILRQEGVRSMFKGAGANVLRSAAAAFVLPLYDFLQLHLFGKAYGAGSG